MALSQNVPEAQRPNRSRHPSIVWPTILIGLGALFLAQNLGLVASGLWLEVWRLWPLFLVLVGLDFILGRRGGWASAAAMLGILAFIAVAIALTTTVSYLSVGNSGWIAGGSIKTDHIAEDMNGIGAATVDLRHGSGRLTISALPAGSAQLIAANLDHLEDTQISRQITRQGDRATIVLGGAVERRLPFGGQSLRDDWTIQLAQNAALDLRIASGASEVDIDLRELIVNDLDIRTGASAVRVLLPEAARQTKVHIRAGAAGIELTVPDGVAGRISTAGGLNNVALDRGRFPMVGRYFQSPNFERAENRVDIEVESGVSSITVR